MRQPLIKASEWPFEIMCRVFGIQPFYGIQEETLLKHADYAVFATHLRLFQKGGENRRWEDYRLKMPPETLEKMAEILSECRRNGFVNPIAYGGPADTVKIAWKRIITSAPQADLCTLCDRTCERRDNLEDGYYHREGKEEPSPCW